jgi:hypothetical protein
MRLRKQIDATQEAIERERAALDSLTAASGAAEMALLEAQSRQPLVESLVGFLVGKREQNGFSQAYRITALTRSDVTERHA